MLPEYKIIEIENWKRKEHYLFFSSFEEPFHGLTVNFDVTNTKDYALQQECSFTIRYMFLCLQAIQKSEAFRLRIEENEVRLYEHIDFGTTIIKEDKTFVYVHIPYSNDFDQFQKSFLAEKKHAMTRTALFSGTESSAMIHTSVLPWTQFTSLSHARKYSNGDSVPKITFGKVQNQSNRLIMPVSIHAHHALVDGIDMAQFVQEFQELLDQ